MRRNPKFDIQDPELGAITVQTSENVDPTEFAPWFIQLRDLDESDRNKIKARALKLIGSTKPEASNFIKKFGCELVGFIPRVEYSLAGGDEDADVTWVHAFSIPTLLFWCKEGGFGFFINANLDFDDTVLNKIEGNPKQHLRGFTA